LLFLTYALLLGAYLASYYLRPIVLRTGMLYLFIPTVICVALLLEAGVFVVISIL